jgi:F-type H+-transporting ATPase subunit b
MTPRLRALTAALGLSAALTAGIAFAQQPAPPPPSPAGQPPAPAGQPPVRVQRIDPSQLPPGFQRPGGPAAPGAPMGRPGPGAPPGVRRPAARPVAHEEPEEHGGGHGEEHCPGHGPEDPPPAPNWWRGILMVNNELAQSPSAINQLLFRYENEKEPCDPKNQPPPFLATVLNFGLLAFILYRFGRKPLAEALVKRKQAITAEIDNAQRLKADAEARLETYEEKFERMEETLEELRSEYAVQAEQEKKHVLAEAEERRARMRRDAEFRIEQELKSAQAELLQEAVANAVKAAEELLAQRVGPSDLDRLADDYLSSVGPAMSAKPTAARASTEGGSR